MNCHIRGSSNRLVHISGIGITPRRHKLKAVQLYKPDVKSDRVKKVEVNPMVINIFSVVLIWMFALKRTNTSPSPSSFQASQSTNSTVPSLLALANASVSKNDSKDVGASFLTGIGSKTYVSIFTNWPVVSLHSS